MMRKLFLTLEAGESDVTPAKTLASKTTLTLLEPAITRPHLSTRIAPKIETSPPRVIDVVLVRWCRGRNRAPCPDGWPHRSARDNRWWPPRFSPPPARITTPGLRGRVVHRLAV